MRAECRARWQIKKLELPTPALLFSVEILLRDFPSTCLFRGKGHYDATVQL